jgi:hypothetical protein
MTPVEKITTGTALEKAIRDGEMIGARLLAGSSFSGKAERELVGSLITQLADVARRARAAGRLALVPDPQDG